MSQVLKIHNICQGSTIHNINKLSKTKDIYEGTENKLSSWHSFFIVAHLPWTLDTLRNITAIWADADTNTGYLNEWIQTIC